MMSEVREKQEPGREALPALWPYLLLCAAVAIWIDFGSLHRLQHSDSVLPALVSLYRWMPFYWELDRLGMLVALVARPIKHPLFNLLLQNALYVFCGLSALVLLPRYLLRNAAYPAAGMLGVAAFLALAPAEYRFEFLVDTEYGVWLFLGLGSLILLEAPERGALSWPRWLASAALMILAHWAYCTTTMFLGPLLVFRTLFCYRGESSLFALLRRDGPGACPDLRERRSLGGWRNALRENAAAAELGRSLAVLAIGFLAGLALMRLAPIRHTSFAALPPGEWVQTWTQLSKNTWNALAPQRWPWFLLSGAALGLSAYCFPAVRKSAQVHWRAAAAALTAATMISLFIGTRQWVVANLCVFRYWQPAVMMAQAALLALAVSPLAAVMRAPKWRIGYAASAPLAFCAAAFSYGWPSLEGVYRDIDPYYYNAAAVGPPSGIGTRDLLESGCTHVAGNYWTVWHAVFRANLALYERGENRVVWGISLRSTPTRRYWSKIPRESMRVAIAAGGDPQADVYLAHYQLTPLELSEKRETLWLLQPSEVLASKAGGQAPVNIVRRPEGR